MEMHTPSNKLLIGRNEWCQIPDLNLPAIKAKIDTGAKTSSIHASNIKPITKNNLAWVTFDVHPINKCNTKAIVKKLNCFMNTNLIICLCKDEIFKEFY